MSAAPVFATKHDELVHPSVDTPEFEDAVASLLAPYASYSKDAAPLMRDLYLAPNAGIEPTSGALRGYVAAVSGMAPATASEEGETGVLTSAIGTGTTWLRVKTADGRRIEDDALEKAFKPVDEYTTPGMRVAVVTGLEYPALVHYVVVTGNDVAAATALVEAASKSKASVEDVVAGALAPALDSVMKKSHDARVRTANEFMAAHGLAADESVAVSNAPTNFFVHSAALSVPAESSQRGAHNVYLAYSAVADPSTAHSGLMLYRGPIAGAARFMGPATTSKGLPSSAWSNAKLAPNSPEYRPFSMMPADTGLYTPGTKGRIADRHKGSSPVFANLHTRRVKQSGAIQSYNPLANEIYHSPHDEWFTSSLARLGTPLGERLSCELFEAVTTQLPALDTTRMALGELVELATKASEKEFRVETGAFLKMIAPWPKAASQPLATIFANQKHGAVAVSVDMLRAIYSHAAASPTAVSVASLAKTAAPAHDEDDVGVDDFLD